MAESMWPQKVVTKVLPRSFLSGAHTLPPRGGGGFFKMVGASFQWGAPRAGPGGQQWVGWLLASPGFPFLFYVFFPCFFHYLCFH